MIEVPDSSALESAAEILREGTPHWCVPGSAHDWRSRVADWLEAVAAEQDAALVWRCSMPGGIDTPLRTPGFTPCPECRVVSRG